MVYHFGGMSGLHPAVLEEAQVHRQRSDRTSPQSPLGSARLHQRDGACALLLLVNRRKLQRLLPQMDITAESAPRITRHLVDFALAGLRAISARRNLR
jgi:hypothetical protein